MPIVIETEDEFRTRHGSCVHDGIAILFEDGASIQHGNRLEPSDNPDERQVAIYNYTQAKVRQLVSRFNVARNNIKMQAELYANDFGPAPRPEDMKTLRAKADELIDWKLQLEVIEEKLPVSKQQRIKSSVNANQQTQANKMLRELQKLPTF